MTHSLSGFALVTVSTYSYLAGARVMVKSFLKHHPQCRAYVCIVEPPRDPSVLRPDEPFTVFYAEQLGIDNWCALAFKYNVTELSTMLKPFAIAHVLREHERVVFIDSDIVIYNPLDGLAELLERFDVVLTPHILTPSDETFAERERADLLTGIYNTGLVAVSRREDAHRMLAWWQTRLRRFGTLNIRIGEYIDQHWIDHAPVFFSGFGVWRDPGCNVGKWNLQERHVETETHIVYCQERFPLRFFHFSAFPWDDPSKLSKNLYPHVTAFVTPAVLSLLNDYKQRLTDEGYVELRKLPYTYANFDNGVPIPDVVRKYYLSVDPFGQRWSNPFITGKGSFFEYAQEKERKYVTRVAAHTFDVNEKMRASMLKNMANRDRMTNAWFHAYGEDKFQITDEFLAPLRPKSLWGRFLAVIDGQRGVNGVALRERLRRLRNLFLGIRRA
jgi:hypothetical protein